jgi:hypothetical protein
MGMKALMIKNSFKAIGCYLREIAGAFRRTVSPVMTVLKRT